MTDPFPGSDRPVLVVVGAGPGIGAAVAHRFGKAGYDVTLVARTLEHLEQLTADLARAGVSGGWLLADITDEAALRDALSRLGEQTGHIDVVHFNPSVFRERDLLDLGPDELLEDVRVGAASLLTVVQAVRPYLPHGARILATGSMAADKPYFAAASLGVQKAALRNLVHSIDSALAPDGVRAMSLTVRGTLDPDTEFAPERVADALYEASLTPDESWHSEVPYNG